MNANKAAAGNLKIVLASASPRRLALLRGVGLEPIVHPAHVDEAVRPGEQPHDLVLRLARAKAEAVAAERDGPSAPGMVIAADTAVVSEGRALGKPADVADAERMLRHLSGGRHQVMTGVWLVRTDRALTSGGVAVTDVIFRELDEALVRAYARSGEPMDKAGGYAIQGRGALLVERIEGSWSAVVGLPLERLPGWIGELGFGLGNLLDWYDLPA